MWSSGFEGTEPSYLGQNTLRTPPKAGVGRVPVHPHAGGAMGVCGQDIPLGQALTRITAVILGSIETSIGVHLQVVALPAI